jgi:hypothetical protein
VQGAQDGEVDGEQDLTVATETVGGVHPLDGGPQPGGQPHGAVDDVVGDDVLDPSAGAGQHRTGGVGELLHDRSDPLRGGEDGDHHVVHLAGDGTRRAGLEHRGDRPAQADRGRRRVGGQRDRDQGTARREPEPGRAGGQLGGVGVAAADEVDQQRAAGVTVLPLPVDGAQQRQLDRDDRAPQGHLDLVAPDVVGRGPQLTPRAAEQVQRFPHPVLADGGIRP